MMRRVAFALLGTAAALMSCSPDFLGPSSRARFGALAINPTLPRASQVSGGDIVPFTNVRIILRRSDESVAIDTIVAFPSNAEEISLALSVPLSSSATSDGESFSLMMEYRNAAGDVVFRAGPVVVILTPFVPGGPAPAPVDVPADYVGPGSQATRVEISPTAITLSANQATTFTAQAFDVDVLLPGTPVFFTTSDAAIVDVTTAGAATAKNVRGTATITANLLTGQTANATVTVELPASSLVVGSGDNQTGAVSAQLPANVVARVVASDGVGVAGVTVTFAAANGGSVGSPSVVTDGQGYAATTWTLGAAAGAQTMTATAAGLTGSPLTFTATATAGAATQLTITTQPQSVVAGAAIGGPVTVTARDAGGAVATSFNGNVTLSIASGPAGATLDGTVTVAAVAGVAMFPNVSITRAGTGYTLTAQSGVLTGATTNSFNISPAAAAQLAFTVQPASASVGAPIAPPVEVTALDAFANTVTSFAGTVTISIGTNPGGATLGGTTSVNAVAGVATFSTLSLNAAGSGYTLTAASGALTQASSAPFTIGGLTPVVWTNALGGAWSTPSNWNLNRIPQPGDSVVITLAGNYTVTITAPSGAAYVTLGALSGTQSLQITSSQLNVSNALLINGNGVLELNAANVVGSGTVANAGLISVHGGSSIENAITTAAGSGIRIEGTGTYGFAQLTHTAAFTNEGTIELTSVGGVFPATITSLGGAITNDGLILLNAGAQGSRILNSPIINQASLSVEQGATLTKSLTNSGGVSVIGGDLSATFSGSDAIINTGTISINTGRMLSVSGGAFSHNAGTITGSGMLALTGVNATFAVNFTNTNTALELSSTTVFGPGTITNAPGKTLMLHGATFNPNAPIVNQGTLLAHGPVNIASPFTAAAGSTLRIEGIGTFGFASAALNGFVNAGTIDLTSSGGVFPATLTIVSGSLTNAPGGTLLSSAGTDGTRTINGSIVNSGTVTVNQATSFVVAGGSFDNEGTIDLVGGDATLIQNPTGSFTNTSTLAIGSARTFAVNGGSFFQNAGVITGTGTLSLTSVGAQFVTNFSTAATGLVLTSSSVGGPGTITNASGRTLALSASSILANAPLDNQGTIVAHGASSIEGPITTGPSSVVRIEGTGTYGFATLETAPFTNNGTARIELTSAGGVFPATLEVVGGPLTNAIGATIESMVSTGGARTINAPVINNGTLTVNQPLSVTLAGAGHNNAGTIELVGGDLSFVLGGGSLTNAGTLSIGAARTLFISGGEFNQNAGAITGAGTLDLNGVAATFQTSFTNAVTTLALTSSVLNGPGTITNAAGRSLTLNASTLGAGVLLVNDGLLVAHGGSAINGSVQTSITSNIRVEGNGAYGFATLAVTNGFQNNGVIELTSIGGVFPATLDVQLGELENEASGTIASLAGTGGARTIDAQLNNDGTLAVGSPLTLSEVSGVHTNAGSINVTGGDLTQVTGVMNNAGSITISSGFAFNMNVATLNQAGTITGAGALNLNSVNAAFGVDFDNALTTLSLTGSTVDGPGVITNALGRTLVLNASTINATAPLVNLGTVIVRGGSRIDGPYTAPPGSTLRIEGTSTYGFATLTVANAFTNAGTIELTSDAGVFPSTLIVSAGMLTNAVGGKIVSMPGSGGGRTLNAQLANLGTVNIDASLAMLSAPDVVHANVGLIDVAGGDLTVTQSGIDAAFGNTGSIQIGPARIFTISGGSFVQDIGTIGGTGLLAFNGVQATFNTPFSNAITTLAATNSEIGGLGKITNAPGKTLILDQTEFIGLSLFENQGILIARGNAAINGSLITSAGSTIRVEGTSTYGFGTLSIASGFFNAGNIEMTSTGGVFPADIAVASGEIVSGPGTSLTTLAGTGGARTFNGQLLAMNDITLTPGAFGKFTMTTQRLTISGKYSVEIGGLIQDTEYDRLAVVGGEANIVLGATLDVQLRNGFEPKAGDIFTVLTTETGLQGAFTTLSLPALPGGLSWTVETQAGNLVLTVR